MIITRSPIVTLSFTKSSSFVNKNGEHPRLGYVMEWNEIVLKKEDMLDNNWLYVGGESEDIATQQLKTMAFHQDWLPIVEE